MSHSAPPHPLAPFLATLAGLLSGACAAAVPAAAPLEVVASPELDFAAVLAGPDIAWESVRGDAAGGDSAQPPPGAAAPGARSTDGPGRFVSVRCSVLALDGDDALRWLGLRVAGPTAQVVPPAELRARVEALRRARPEVELQAPQLLLWPGRRGSLAQMDETAYVREFRVEATGGALVADPAIGVLGEGFSLAVEAAHADTGPREVTVELTFGERLRPTPESDFGMAWGSALTIQQPLLLAQRVGTRTLLADDQALVLVGLGRQNSSELLFTILTAEPYEAR